ncbi:MAG TPA: DNA polymerase III subunit gamma/tau, partial [Thermomicrobiales bacterium]|nr:DNA polymerase III subunit gamma/tau [Thermomicrobiales bacterium]
MTDGSLFNLSGLEQASPAQQSGDAGSLGQSQSLYRKYRPQTFAEDDLFGQEHVVNTLRNAIALNRIAHAYLFCGPRGTGKTTTARLLAKAVNCLDPDPYKRPCNVCASCVAINKGATTDVIEIDAASNRGIDDIRDLRERVKYAPTQLRTKFYIIDEAHQITGAAANAFLKTLEEPPAHTKFVLATTDPEELLQTIVSRCQRFDFRRINLEAMQACIRKVAGEESIAIDDDAVMAIARHATGSLRDALGLLDQLAVYREDDQHDRSRVTLDLVRTVLGVSRNDRVEAIVRALADRDAAAGLQAIGGALDDGEDMRQLGRQLVSYIRMLLLQRAGGSDDADQTARELAERFSLHEIAGLVKLFADIDYKVKHATLSQLPLELAIVEGTLRGQSPAEVPRREAPGLSPAPVESMPARRELREEWTPPEEPERPVERPRTSLRDRVRGAPSAPAERQVRTGGAENPSPAATPISQPSSSTPQPAPVTSTPPPVVAVAAAQVAASNDGPEIRFEMVIELWPKIKSDVKAVNRRIEALLQQIDPVAIVGDKLILVSAYEFHRNRVNADEARNVIEEVVGRLLKRRLAVSAVTREEAQ